MDNQKHLGNKDSMHMDKGQQQMMPMQMEPNLPQGMFESEMIGAIKIKDGLFIGDELASTVSLNFLSNGSAGLGICSCK